MVELDALFQPRLLASRVARMAPCEAHTEAHLTMGAKVPHLAG